MTYRAIFTVLIVLTVVATLCIGIMKPQMHKSVFVYNSDYEIKPTQEIIVEQKDIPIMEQPASDNAKQIEVESKDFVTVQETKISSPIQVTNQTTNSTPVTTVKTTPVKVQSTKLANQKTGKSVQTVKTTNPQIDLQKIVENNQKIQTSVKPISSTPAQTKTETVQTKTVQTAPKPITTAPQPKTVTQPKVIPQTKSQTQKVLTAQEEEIAWNIWRSNLTNKIMQDTNFPPVPAGTIFHYKFDVDKFGKITNVQTWSENSKYTPYAIQYMAPVIRNLQGRSILVFPQGTARTSVNAWGAWKISNRTIYSTPDNYNDIEKVTK